MGVFSPFADCCVHYMTTRHITVRFLRQVAVIDPFLCAKFGLSTFASVTACSSARHKLPTLNEQERQFAYASLCAPKRSLCCQEMGQRIVLVCLALALVAPTAFAGCVTQM